jgi:hypothetical protein
VRSTVLAVLAPHLTQLAKCALCVQQLSLQRALLSPARCNCSMTVIVQSQHACVPPVYRTCTGLRWSERDSYCRYIPDSSQWPAVDPTQQFVDFTCIFPLSQCYLTLILQVRGGGSNKLFVFAVQSRSACEAVGEGG